MFEDSLRVGPELFGSHATRGLGKSQAKIQNLQFFIRQFTSTFVVETTRMRRDVGRKQTES